MNFKEGIIFLLIARKSSIPENEANKAIEIETDVRNILTMNGVYEDTEGQYSSLTDEEKSALQDKLEAKIDRLVGIS